MVNRRGIREDPVSLEPERLFRASDHDNEMYQQGDNMYGNTQSLQTIVRYICLVFSLFLFTLRCFSLAICFHVLKKWLTLRMLGYEQVLVLEVSLIESGLHVVCSHVLHYALLLRVCHLFLQILWYVKMRHLQHFTVTTAQKAGLLTLQLVHARARTAFDPVQGKISGHHSPIKTNCAASVEWCAQH